MNAVLKLESPAFGLVLPCPGPFAGTWEVFKWGQWISTLWKQQQLLQKQSVNNLLNKSGSVHMIQNQVHKNVKLEYFEVALSPIADLISEKSQQSRQFSWPSSEQ